MSNPYLPPLLALMGVEPGIPPVDTHLVEEEKPRLSRQSEQILALLEDGPATNVQLMQVAQRFGARIHDLRHAGYDVRIESRNRATGLVTYTLIRKAS